MFEDTFEKWIEYISRHRPAWEHGDPRHSLDGEVRTRLEQLDLLLGLEQAALDKVAIDPAESQAIFEYMLASRAALASGEMRGEEYVCRDPSKEPTARGYVRLHPGLGGSDAVR